MREIVFVCIGCTGVVGDSLGPLVGDILIKKDVPCFVYGTPQRPVHAQNLPQYAKFISKFHPSAKIVAIDACLGKLSDVGSISVLRGGITPGKALNKQATVFGDAGVLAIVGEAGADPLAELKSRSLAFIDRLAEKTAETVVKAFL